MLFLGVGESEAQISANEAENQGLYPKTCLVSQELKISGSHQESQIELASLH